MTFAQIYAQLFNTKAYVHPDEFIRTFEQNRDLISSQKWGVDNKLDNQILHLFSSYAMHLSNRERYKEAKIAIKEAIGLFDTHPIYSKNDLFKTETYEQLYFHQAAVTYYLSDYKKSKQAFSFLHERFPNNETYKIWLDSFRELKLKKLSNWAFNIAGILFSVSVFLDIFEVDKLSLIVLTAASPFILSFIILKGMIYLKRKKTR